MTNREKRLAKDMYRNFVGRYERGTLRANDLYRLAIMREIEAEKADKTINNLLRVIGLMQENERKLIEIVVRVLE